MADNVAVLLQVLTQTGCQCHAVGLTALGITSLQALSDRASEAASQGAAVTPDREDLPVRRRYASASFDAALRAAHRLTANGLWTTWTPTSSPGHPHDFWRPTASQSQQSNCWGGGRPKPLSATCRRHPFAEHIWCRQAHDDRGLESDQAHTPGGGGNNRDGSSPDPTGRWPAGCTARPIASRPADGQGGVSYCDILHTRTKGPLPDQAQNAKESHAWRVDVRCNRGPEAPELARHAEDEALSKTSINRLVHAAPKNSRTHCSRLCQWAAHA